MLFHLGGRRSDAKSQAGSAGKQENNFRRSKPTGRALKRLRISNEREDCRFARGFRYSAVYFSTGSNVDGSFFPNYGTALHRPAA